jgi:intracellular multiplication protein IcmP
MSSAGQDNADKNSTGIIWMAGLILVTGAFLWYQLKYQLIGFYVSLKHIELIFLQYFSQIIPLPINSEIPEMINYLEFIHNRFDPDLNTIGYIGKKVGFYMNFFYALICFFITHQLWQKNSLTKFIRKHTMQTLSDQEKNNWTIISPVIGKKIIEKDINKGPWAMADTPLQFCKKHDLLEIETIADRKNPWRLEGVQKATLITKKALPILKAQMGTLWEGIDKLAPHRKALFAIFLARIENDKKAADDLLEDLSVSYAKGKIDYDAVAPILNKHQNSKVVQQCIQRHAYTLTVLAALLELSRTSGVLAASNFLWLKLVDRHLWYMLNCVGRQTPFSEVSAPWAHFIAEKEMGRALFKPIIDESVNALEEAISKVIYTESEDEQKKEHEQT